MYIKKKTIKATSILKAWIKPTSYQTIYSGKQINTNPPSKPTAWVLRIHNIRCIKRLRRSQALKAVLYKKFQIIAASDIIIAAHNDSDASLLLSFNNTKVEEIIAII